MASVVDRLKVYINSSSPIVVIETLEEPRALEVVRAAASELNMGLFEWSIADGLARTDGTFSKLRLTSENAASQPPINNTQPAAGVLAHMMTLTVEAVFVLKDFHRHIEDPVVTRRLREVAQLFSSDRRTVIITAPAVVVPPELQNQVEYIDLPLPDRTRLAQIVEETYARLKKKLLLARTLDAAGVATVAENLCALTEDEAERTVAHSIVTRHTLDEQVAGDVLQAKKEMLKRSGILEFIDCPEAMGSVGGLENLKRWLARRQGTWSEAARAAGLEPPRGVIIMGVQGCGKSMCARAIAGEWGLPLVRFDTAAIYDKYVGETEKRIRRVFHVAEQLAPAVLWIDELEKVFAGSGADSASSDAGVSSRLLAAFLSWMQDRKAPVFVAATCNNVAVLPPELIRKGRFDEIFFVDLPNLAERRAILSAQFSRRKQNPDEFDLEKLARQSEGYSGAEIEAAIKSAMYAAFSEKKRLVTETVLQELSTSTPLSATRSEDIAALRSWAANRAVPATAVEAPRAAAARRT